MREFVISDAPDQEFTTILNGQRCGLRFRYSPTTDRWNFDLRIADELVLIGRRVVTGVDLVGAFDFGIGGIFAGDFEGKGAAPGRTEIPERRIRIYQIDPAEIAEIVA
jgi:hypothetical protein